MKDLEKFTDWLIQRGVEILPKTNEYEVIRFRGRQVGVVYTSGKVSNDYTYEALKSFRQNKSWNGAPINTGRYNSYKKQKERLIIRDGVNCFYCGLGMGEDITVEHLISLNSGGKNTLSNMVLCHAECNHKVGVMPISEKVKFAIKNRIENLE